MVLAFWMSPGGKGSQFVRLTTLPPSCADCLEILGKSNYSSHRKYIVTLRNPYSTQKIDYTVFDQTNFTINNK